MSVVLGFFAMIFFALTFMGIASELKEENKQFQVCEKVCYPSTVYRSGKTKCECSANTIKEIK